MSAMSRKLTKWYRAARILYPWRRTSDPYHIWVSEILLQQTRIPVALPYYERIVKEFPSFQDLASAKSQKFLAAWSGIGYYRRAENMLACARQIVAEYGGNFPDDAESMLRLPGIGSYTAGAILNLCFDKLTPAIDGNVGRVLSRMTGCGFPLHSRSFRKHVTEAFLEYGRGVPSGEYLQSLMELGQRICLPKPACPTCPVRAHCKSFRNGTTHRIPAPSPAKKSRWMHWYFLLLRKGQAYWFVQNPGRGFLKSAWLFPDLLCDSLLSTGELRSGFRKHWNVNVDNPVEQGSIRHHVTFRKITAHIIEAEWKGTTGNGVWLTPLELRKRHTSSVVRKVLEAIT